MSKALKGIVSFIALLSFSLVSVFLSQSYSQILPFIFSEFNPSSDKNQGRNEVIKFKSLDVGFPK